MSNLEKSSYYVLILMLSIIGAILFSFTEFGGYTAYYSYSVNLQSVFSNPDLIAYSPIYLLLDFLFLLNIFLSLKELNIIKLSFPKKSANLGFFSSLGIFAITTVSGVAFVALLSDAGDWWFGAGFYAGIIGGILLPILYRMSMKNASASSTQYNYPPPPPPQ
jgi:hypothetical protein